MDRLAYTSAPPPEKIWRAASEAAAQSDHALLQMPLLGYESAGTRWVTPQSVKEKHLERLRTPCTRLPCR